MAEKTVKNEASAPAADDEFVITRLISAPPSLVYKAWTEPKHLAAWWGPKIFTNPVCDLDVCVGGEYRIVMQSPQGVNYPIKGVFREIVPNKRLVMTMDCSEHPQEWHDLVNPTPEMRQKNPVREMVMTVFFDNAGGKTQLTIRVRMASKAIRDSLLKLGMTEGWSESLQKLEKMLAKN